jgi:hypothetical protein
MSGSEITKWIVRGSIGLAFALLGSFLIGRQTNITINFGGQPTTPAPAPSYRADPSHPPRHDYERKREDDSRLGDILREEGKSGSDRAFRR